MGGSESKTDCPEDNRSLTININGNLNVILDRPRFDLNSGCCPVPSEPRVALDYSHTRRRHRPRPSFLDLPGGSGKDVVSSRRT